MNKISDKALNVFNSKIGLKLILAFLMFSIIQAIFVYTYIRNYVTDQMFNNSRFLNEMAFIKANDVMSDRLDKISRSVKFVLNDTDFISTLSGRYKNSDTYEMVNAINRINNYVNAMKNNQDISDIVLYLPDDNPLHEYLTGMNRKYLLSQNRHFDEITAETSWVLMPGPDHEKDITLIRYIFSTGDFRYIIAALYISIKPDYFDEIINNAANTVNTEVYMLNSMNQVILSSEKIKDALDENTVLNNLQKEYSEFDSYLFNQKGEKTFISYRKNSRDKWYNPGWTLVSITPVEEILEPINSMFRNILLVTLVLVSVFFIFAFLFSASITGRINNLIWGMRQVQKGKFRDMIIPKGSDEITELTSDFNYMIKRIEILISDNINYINDSRKKELMALQSQIKPHFLYNTLDLVNWMALKYGIYDISEIVQSLSKFYKLSLNQGREIVTLQDELDHVKAYLKIQNKRFEGAISFIIDVAPEFLSCPAAKLSLQPLVENSIMHGLLPKENKKGSIKISAEKRDDKLVILVWDDGKGIEAETLKNLNSGYYRAKTGYGLSNVDERIKLDFGQKYGLKIESLPGEYTLVSVTLPFQFSGRRANGLPRQDR